MYYARNAAEICRTEQKKWGLFINCSYEFLYFAVYSLFKMNKVERKKIMIYNCFSIKPKLLVDDFAVPTKQNKGSWCKFGIITYNPWFLCFSQYTVNISTEINCIQFLNALKILTSAAFFPFSCSNYYSKHTVYSISTALPLYFHCTFTVFLLYFYCAINFAYLYIFAV